MGSIERLYDGKSGYKFIVVGKIHDTLVFWKGTK